LNVALLATTLRCFCTNDGQRAATRNIRRLAQAETARAHGEHMPQHGSQHQHELSSGLHTNLAFRFDDTSADHDPDRYYF
jgi:hypothetical protein